MSDWLRAFTSRRTSSFGIFDQLNLDLKFALVVPSERQSSRIAKGLDILAEGIKEIADASASIDVRSIEGVTKESLALKPVKIVLKDSQKYLSIGYDWAN